MGILSAFRFAFQNLFFTPVLYGVIASLAVFSATWEKGDRLKDQVTDSMRSQLDTFDFIVVGAGSAGAVVANRLSEHHSVLLLEVGGESHPFQAIPGLALFLPNYPGTDWSHKTVTQTHSCLACPEKKFTWSQGRNLGGSGNLNYLIHLRGNPRDFDNWARITDDPSWSYEGVLPFFKKSENFVGDSPDKAAHGIGGEMQIQYPDYIGLAPEWNYAGKELGFEHLDLNGHYIEGFDTIYYPIKKGVRQATYRAFIQTARGRKNLVIRKFAKVLKLLIREGSNDVYGVEYDRHHQRGVHAFANKEVILSAGAVFSPKILMLSGIGPWQQLQDCGIHVKADLPVGKNLQDHITTILGPFFINQPRSLLIDRDITPSSFIKFGTAGTGPLTSSGFQAVAHVTSPLAKDRGELGWPDLQLTLFGVAPHRLFPSDMAHAFGLREDLLSKYFFHARKKDAFFIFVSAARPVARGEVTLHSSDPYKRAVIDPRYLEDPSDIDIKVLIEGVKSSVYLAENTTAFQNLHAHFTWEKFPGCEKLWFRSDEYWECYIRHLSVTMNDACGTCPMGVKGSGDAVVDSELKVIGVNHLRVIDASVMPKILVSNLQAATIMIGEKGAHMIHEAWKNSESSAPYGQNLVDGKNTPHSQDDFGKLFENNDPSVFDSYGPLQQALQDPANFIPHNQNLPLPSDSVPPNIPPQPHPTLFPAGHPEGIQPNFISTPHPSPFPIPPDVIEQQRHLQSFHSTSESPHFPTPHPENIQQNFQPTPHPPHFPDPDSIQIQNFPTTIQPHHFPDPDSIQIQNFPTTPFPHLEGGLQQNYGPQPSPFPLPPGPENQATPFPSQASFTIEKLPLVYSSTSNGNGGPSIFVAGSTESSIVSSSSNQDRQGKSYATGTDITDPNQTFPQNAVTTTQAPSTKQKFKPRPRIRPRPEGLRVGDANQLSTTPGPVRVSTFPPEDLNENGQLIRIRPRQRQRIGVHPRASLGLNLPRRRIKRPRTRSNITITEATVHYDRLTRARVPIISTIPPPTKPQAYDQVKTDALRKINPYEPGPIRVSVKHAGSKTTEPQQGASNRVAKSLNVLQNPISTSATIAPYYSSTISTIDTIPILPKLSTSTSLSVSKSETRSFGPNQNFSEKVTYKSNISSGSSNNSDNIKNNNNTRQRIRRTRPKAKPSRVRPKSKLMIANKNPALGFHEVEMDSENDLDIAESTHSLHSTAFILHSYVPVDTDPLPQIFAAPSLEMSLRNYSQYIVL